MNNYTFLETFFRLFDLKNAKPVDFVCMANAFREYCKVPELQGETLIKVAGTSGHGIALYFQSGLVISAYESVVYFYDMEDNEIEEFETYEEYSLYKLEGRDNY